MKCLKEQCFLIDDCQQGNKNDICHLSNNLNFKIALKRIGFEKQLFEGRKELHENMDKIKKDLMVELSKLFFKR